MPYAYPPNHHERMEVLNATTASLGWGRDETPMEMLIRQCQDWLRLVQPVLNGEKPMVADHQEQAAALCARLTIERNHGQNREKATPLLAQMEDARSELARIWNHPRLEELRAQAALVGAIYFPLEKKVSQTWPECRSESDEQEARHLRGALRHRMSQLRRRAPLQSVAG